MPSGECKLSIAWRKMFLAFPGHGQTIATRHRRAFQVYNRQLVR
jgi:hypothetical protein